MPETLKNNDKSIRSFILNDVLKKVSIDKSYENLCKVIGNDAIAFYDFQYWYYRFLSGKQDLDFDRSSEPEPLQFSNLPVDAVGLIADKLEMVERLVLRRVSKPLQEFMEKREFDCTSIDVSFEADLISVWYENRQILYTKNDEAVIFYKNKTGIREALIIYGDESEVCDDLACFLKNPKLQLCEFVFSTSISCRKEGVLSMFLKKFENVLKPLKHQTAVRELVFRSERPDNVLAILPYLKPGYLEKILIDNSFGMFDWKSDEQSRKVEQIIQLDQWKQAKTLSLLDALYLFPDEVLGQFEHYWIEVRSLSGNQLAHIRMKFATSPVFEYCYLSIREPCYDSELDFIGVPGPPAKDYRFVRHYMIPNTDKLLVFKERYGDIEIEKKTRDVQ